MRAFLVVSAVAFVFASAAVRNRRDPGHTYDADELVKVLDWLTDDQKSALKALGKDHDALLAKVEEFFKAHDEKDAASEKIIAACKHVISDAIGEDKTAEIKKLKESGAGIDQLEAKVDSLLSGAADSEAKTVASKIKPYCKKVFTWKAAQAAAARLKREIEYNVDTLLEKVLDWMTPEQKAAVKALENDKEALYKKIGEAFKELDGDAKKNAVEKVKEACKHVFSKAIGEDKIGEIKKLKESGASVDDIEAKAKELLAAAPASPLKDIAGRASPYCKKAFAYKA